VRRHGLDRPVWSQQLQSERNHRDPVLLLVLPLPIRITWHGRLPSRPVARSSRLQLPPRRFRKRSRRTPGPITANSQVGLPTWES
jgi:hypothetical protein